VFGALRSLSAGQWTALLINTLLSCVFAPALIITALESTTATAVVLLLQTDAIFLAVSGVLFFGERLSTRAWTGLTLIGAGATVLAVFAGAGLAAAGVIAAAALRSLGNAAARADLARDETLPAFLFVRNLLGAVIFFGIAMWLFGPHHFMDTFSPGLWELMIVYAGAIVLLGQLSWYRAVSTLPGGTVSAAWTLAPVVSLVVAYLLLGEVPGGPQWVSVGLVFAGLAVMKLGVRHTEKDDARPAAGTERTLAGTE
ncbi:MAG: DMT family transporter, partial [Planctomycetota bacterium]